MRTLLIACLTLAAATAAVAQEAGTFGAGVILGNPTGVTGKYWIDGRQAIDAGVGFSGDAAIYADYIVHSFTLIPQPSEGRLGAYVAVGPRVEVEHDTEFGFRTMGGLNYFIKDHPIEVFLEAGPVFELTPDWTVQVDAGIGVRFYFGGSGSAAK